jgi:hypothetical protein
MVRLDYLLLNEQIRARRELRTCTRQIGRVHARLVPVVRRIYVNSRRITAAALVAASVAGAACSDDNNDNPVGTANNNTTVRFVNVTTANTKLDIAQNGTVGAGNGNVAFGSASACTKVNNANPQLAVRTAGSTTSLPGFVPAFAANGMYTVLITGTTASPVFTTLNDQVTTPSAGNAAVRIINATTAATTGAGNWDIYLNPPTTGSIGTPVATAIGRTMASAFLTVPAGQANTLRLTNSGQTASVLTVAGPTLTAGQVTTIVVTDAAAGSTTLQTFPLPACTTT